MAIAKVRIAPVDRWCEFHKIHLEDARRSAICASLVGMEVEIITNSMRMSVIPECLGRLWSHTKKTTEKLTQKGCVPSGDGICEHMLEMD